MVCSPLLGAVLLLSQTDSAAAPAVIFTKEFPGSQPEYFSLRVEENGQALYRTAPDDHAPVRFPLSRGVVEQILALSRKLNQFRDVQLESNRRVASMGKKTLAYENGVDRFAATFNHTENPDAAALMTLFEKLSQTQQHFLKLQYLIRFDRLGVVKELLQLESNLDAGRLLEPVLLTPVLEQIQKDRALVQVAQARAAHILAKIPSPAKE